MGEMRIFLHAGQDDGDDGVDLVVGRAIDIHNLMDDGDCHAGST